MMGNFLERPLIKKDFECKYPLILLRLNAHLDSTHTMIDRHMHQLKSTGWAPVHINMPNVAGNLIWAREIKQRITIPMDLFKALHHP